MSMSELINVIKQQIRTERELIELLNRAVRATETGSAFQEQRNVLSNNAEEMVGWSSSINRGKFFARGAFGLIQSMEVYVRNLSGAAGTITFSVSVLQGSEEKFEIVLPVPAGTRASWVTVNVAKRWIHWGIFLYVTAVTGNVQYAYDEAEDTPDGYETTAVGDGWLGMSNRRFWFRLNVYGQSRGQIGVGGNLAVTEIEKHMRVVLTDEDGNITGVGLPLYATTIIGSGESYFNAMTDGEERQKAYAAGDTYTAGWAAERDFYPYSVTVILRSAYNNSIRPPCYLEYEGVYIAMTSSDGQRIFTGTLGRDRNIDWDLLTYEGAQYWTGIFEVGQVDLIYRNIAANVALTVLIKNSSGVTLDYAEVYILGATYPIE